MDTACTGASVCSELEYRRYCRDVGVEYNILPNSSAWVSFGDANKVTGHGRMRSLGIEHEFRLETTPIKAGSSWKDLQMQRLDVTGAENPSSRLWAASNG
jgi:hypothetical protein